jgi:nucleoside-diphosphate-sugar epimerase
MEGLAPPYLLVVGGSGFIGSHLAREAVRLGWQVDSIGLTEPSPARRVAGVKYIKADITSAETLYQVAKARYDYVVNLSGYIDHTLFSDGGRRLISAHFDGLLNLVSCLDKTQLRRFVQIGSSDEYGASPAPQLEENREQPISPYSLGKVAATHFLQMINRTENFPAVILRLFLAYGPGQEKKRLIPQIISGCLEDELFPTSAGDQLRDFCYVEDVVRAIFMVLETETVNGQVFNVGSGEPVSIKSVINMICQIITKGRPQFGLVDYRPGENMALYPDINKIKRTIGWRSEVSLATGLARTIEWMRHAS